MKRSIRKTIKYELLPSQGIRPHTVFHLTHNKNCCVTIVRSSQGHLSATFLTSVIGNKQYNDIKLLALGRLITKITLETLSVYSGTHYNTLPTIHLATTCGQLVGFSVAVVGCEFNLGWRAQWAEKGLMPEERRKRRRRQGI